LKHPANAQVGPGFGGPRALLARFAAMRRASSFVGSFAADRRARLGLEVEYASFWPVLSVANKQASVSSTVQGGGKRANNASTYSALL